MARIYISSTYEDLKELREAIYHVLRKMGHDAIAMEDYVATDQRPLDKCLTDVASCDVYIGIFAWRYGYRPPDHEQSITELEFREAVRTGKHCLLFLLHEDAPWSLSKVDPDRSRIETLRDELGRDYTVSFFRAAGDLATEVSIAVGKALEGHGDSADRGGTATVDVTNIRYGEAPPPRHVDAEVLAQAQRQLGRLPVEEISDLGPLPPTSQMAVWRNALFVGRKQMLRDLAETFRGAYTEGQTATTAVTGMGGIGKSQLASEFVHRYGQYFSGGVFWLSFADIAAVPAQVASCGEPGGMILRPDFSQLPLEDQIKEVMSAWKDPLPRLLVFDNCEEEDVLAQWRPPSGGCHVLLTSRREVWDPELGVEVLPLNVLDREESVALLRKHRPDLPEDDADLKDIAEELGDLALAVDLAGRYLDRYRFVVTPKEYLVQLRRPDLLQHRSLQIAKDAAPAGQEHIVARIFALSYERLDIEDSIDALAVAMLARAVWFAPGEPIPRELLRSALDAPGDDDQAKLYAAEDAIRRLTELGLLRIEESGSLTLHRLLTAFARGVIDDNKAQPAVERTLAEAARTRVGEGYPKPLLVLLPHLRVATDAAKEREDSQAGSLCHQLGECLRSTGAFTEAHPYLEIALAIREKVLGDDHPDTAQSLNALANLLRDQGAYQEARPLFERALAIRETVLGEEDPDTATSLDRLATLLQDQGDYQGARPLFERSLAIREKVLGEEHPDTASGLNNLAVLLAYQGAYQEARPLYERALAISEKVLGEEHPNTATSLNNLASLLQDQGAYQEARPLYERALAMREKVLGAEHPDTATSLNNLGMLLKDQGDYQEARLLLERALAIREKVLGEEHPLTATSLDNLGMLLKDQGDYQEARHFLERTLRIYERRYGEEHYLTSGVLQDLLEIDARQI